MSAVPQDTAARSRREAEQRGQVRKLQRIDFADIKPQLAASYVVKHLIKPGTLVAINGASGSGKTFLAVDLGLHVATGRSWRAHRVKLGLVCYFALEGSASAQNRVAAWRMKNLAETASVPLCLCPGPVNLRNMLDVEAVLEFVRDAEAEYGEKCVLVIVDTLSRAMAGGKENQPEDMTALIDGADTVKNRTGAAVVLVHHLGKDESRGGRGHSSLKGALDTEIEISREGDDRIATVTKQRDDLEGARYGFLLESVELGLDDEGDLVTSCIVKATDDLPAARKAPTGKNQAAVWGALQEWQRQSKLDVISDREMRDIFKAQKINSKRMPEVIAWFIKFGWIETAPGGYRLIPEKTS
jgi:hypothetical protein